MTNPLNEQDRGDWLLAYRHTVTKNNPGKCLWELELYALTKMAELAGTFVADPDTEPQDVYPDLARMFGCGSTCDGITTSHNKEFSRLTGHGLSLVYRHYCPGANYSYFAREMNCFWELLPVADAVGIAVSASVIGAICTKLPPETVINLGKESVTGELTGSELRRAEESLPVLIKRCFDAAQTVTLKPHDLYWAELEEAINSHDFEVGNREDETLMPVFGLCC